MKKLLALLVFCGLTVGVVGCGGDPTKPATTPAPKVPDDKGPKGPMGPMGS